jgi:hypothetical protein
MAPPHDISPPLDEQLVLKLERWVVLDEVIDVFPVGRGGWLPLPLDEELANVSGKVGADG